MLDKTLIGVRQMTDTEKDIIKKIFVTHEEIIDTEIAENVLVDLLIEITPEEIFEIIKTNADDLLPVSIENIPQFSNSNDIFEVLRVVIDSGIDGLSYVNIGKYLCNKNAKVGARSKYGENHYKLAMQLGLTSNERPLKASFIGIAVYHSSNSFKRDMIKRKLAMRIPIIQYALLSAEKEKFYIYQYLREFMAESTTIRRRSNIRELLRYVDETSGIEMQKILSNIVW